MSETIDDLRILAKQVRNASSQGENTAERVGHVMEGTLDLIEGASPDLSKYYTKQESDTLLLSKWTYDAARAASWDEASKDRHTHANKPALDLIVYDPVKNVWKFTGNAAFSGDVISYANLGDVDIPTIYEGLPIDNKTIKRDINGVLFAESTTGGSFDESSMWTALGTSISSKLIAQRYLNLAGYATEAYVTEKIQNLGAVFNLKGTKATPSDLPTTGNKVGDVWYVASESVGYIWITDEKGVLRWEKFGEPVDLSAYYTKTETNALLANKWTTDTVLISQWNDAYTLRHSHSNKAIIDGITNTLINNWNSASADAHKHANKPALDLIEYDSAKNVWKFTGNAAFSGDVISYANLGDLNIPGIYEGLPIDNVTIKRNSAGALYSLSGSGGDFDKAAMWSALALSTAEQINKSHLTDALSTYVLTTDSRLSDSRNAADVYAWAKQPNKPTYSYSEITGNAPFDDRYLLRSGGTLSGDLIFLEGKSIYIKPQLSQNATGTFWRNKSGDSIISGIGTLATGDNVDSLFIGWGSYPFTDETSLKINTYGLFYKKNIVLDASNWKSIIDGRYLLSSEYTSYDVLSKIKTVDGSGSELDADLLDGFHEYSFLKQNPIGVGQNFDLNNISGVNIVSGFNVVNSPSNGDIGIFTIPTWIAGGKYSAQFVFRLSGGNPFYRSTDAEGNGLWNELAYLSSNVASATKLQNSRLIYNQPFNGENNVTGKLTTTSIELTDVTYDSIWTKGGIVAEGNTLQLGNIKLVVNPSAKTIRFEMLDGTPCNIVSTGDMIIYN